MYRETDASKGLTYIPVGIIKRTDWYVCGMKGLTDNDVYWWRPLSDAPLGTRDKILFAAYKEIHVNGFQSASLNNILAQTGVTKGALYHHFKSKTELGYAVVDEVLARRIYVSFIGPLEGLDDPLEGFIDLIRDAGASFSMTDIELGCPLTVLAQEMAPIDEGFRTRLIRMYAQWHESIASVLRRARDAGLIIDAVDPDSLAVMIASTLEGSITAAKVAQDLDKLHQCGAGLIQFLQLLRK